jgi:hypothetical protein
MKIVNIVQAFKLFEGELWEKPFHPVYPVLCK